MIHFFTFRALLYLQEGCSISPWLFHHAHLPLMLSIPTPPPFCACPAAALHLSSIPSPSLLFISLFMPTLPLSPVPLNLAPLSLTPQLTPPFPSPPLPFPLIGTPPSPLGSSISS
ncbi:hypothetical protein Q5P01_018167 [Channa striata]|uniref:Uncharacterized protein n=1 Tax=Channa striata TaxID=64152 RepID=A0AA88M468_CHASR|nr:hypothetical protein Q5P01_018167 [Channa striata]